MSDRPLVVDLDGTLIRNDLFAEALVALACDPRHWRDLPVLLALPRAAAKARAARLVAQSAASLPYTAPLIDYLRAQKSAGRRLILATAADAAQAQAVADHLDLFDEVLASDGATNLKGPAKAAALVARFGPRGFDYVGDSRADLAVWREAAAAVLVNASASVAARVREVTPVAHVIADRPNAMAGLWSSLRPHQWVKNLLVLVPLLTAHAYGDPLAWRGALMTFCAFCAVASAFYLFNDLADLNADRAHATKRQRALARGALAPGVALTTAGGLFVLGLGIAWAAKVTGLVLLYGAATAAYSLRLKQLPLVDVFWLAGLYTLRLFGGGQAIGHPVSLWLLAFSSFLFLSLALVKRVGELGAGSPGRRGYTPADGPILRTFGCASAFASCIVLAMFVQNETLRTIYASPALLWGMVPLFLFWQCRLWLSTARGYMHDDPIVYAARDWVSWCVGAALIALIVLARSVPLLLG